MYNKRSEASLDELVDRMEDELDLIGFRITSKQSAARLYVVAKELEETLRSFLHRLEAHMGD